MQGTENAGENTGKIKPETRTEGPDPGRGNARVDETTV
jgi:hypothetical protein